MKNCFFSVFLFSFSMTYSSMVSFHSTDIQGTTINSLIVQAIRDIKISGWKAHDNYIRIYDVNFALTQNNDGFEYELANYRVPFVCGLKGIRNFARELFMSLNYHLIEPYTQDLQNMFLKWQKNLKKNKRVNFNYGYYIFHQKLSDNPEQTQLDRVVDCLVKNPYSENTCISMNQSGHHTIIKFNLIWRYFMCTVSISGIDVFVELPYQMGFFSFVHELVYRLVLKKLLLGNETDKWAQVKLGYLVMKTDYAQIHPVTESKALELLLIPHWDEAICDSMPLITDPEETLKDICNGTFKTAVMLWILKYANS